jgi:hypothetical protein
MDRKTGSLFIMEPGMRVPIAGVISMKLEGFSDGKSTAMMELGIFVLWVSDEGSASKIGVEVAISMSADQPIADRGHPCDPVESIPLKGLTSFQEDFSYMREMTKTIYVSS